MPRPPQFAAAVHQVAGSVYTTLASKLEILQGECYAFHVGDTWMEPADGTRMQDLTVAEHPGMHRYAAPQGHPALIEALRDDLEHRYGWSLASDEVLIAAGATGALGAVTGALLDPGDEVLLAAPYWPLIEGIVRSFRGSPVAVPVFAPRLDIDAMLSAFDGALTEKTSAVYWNTPNNPSGRALRGADIEALVRWAGERGLWVLADEV
ncbi:MAG: aminotransferase class I/II-fold pyridoxal phosphate-dependent enzyme, partial [Pseudomonadota bacterium]